jgi:hypothetical protein
MHKLDIETLRVGMIIEKCIKCCQPYSWQHILSIIKYPVSSCEPVSISPEARTVFPSDQVVRADSILYHLQLC